MKQETTVISILNELVRTPAPDLDAAITRVLGRMAQQIGAERAYVFLVRSGEVMDNTHEWVAEGVAPMRARLQGMPLQVISGWRQDLENDRVAHIPSVAALAPDAPERATLEAQSIRSLLIVPIAEDGRLVGLAGLDRTRSEAPFPEEAIQLLRAVADVIHSVLLRRETQVALERTSRKLELTLAALPDLLIEVDRDGICRGVHYNRDPGWPAEPRKMLGKTLEQALRPEIAVDLRDVMGALERGEAVAGIERQLDPDDPKSWSEVSISLRESLDQDDPGGYLFLIRNISECKAREAELAAANADLHGAVTERDTILSRLRDLSAISDDWVWEQDADLRYTYMSENIARFGVTPAFFIGRTREEVGGNIRVDPEDPGWQQITRKMQAREPFRDLFYTAQSVDGQVGYLRFSASPIYDENGEFAGYRGIGSDVTELRRRELEALETARRFEAILTALPDLLIEVDASGRYTGFITGPDELQVPHEGSLEGRSLEEVLPPDIAALSRKALQTVLAEGRIDGLRYALEIDGVRRTFEVSGARKESPLPEGAPTAIFLVRDATADTAQRDELARMAKIVATMTNFVVVVDRDLRVVWLNHAFQEKSGWTLDEIRGEVFADLVRCPESDPATAEALRQALERHEPFRGETVNKDRFGNRYWIDFNVQPLFGIDGELQGFVTVETDITEHKRQRAEVARLASEATQARQRLENALDSLPDGVVVLDNEQRLVIASKAYRDMFPGMEPVLIEGASLDSLLRYGIENTILPDAVLPDGSGTIEEALARRLATYELPKYVDEVQTPDGSWVRRINVRTSDGGSIAVGIDITARRNQIAALDAANAELTNALAERDQAQQQLDKVMEGAAIGTWEWNNRTQTLTVGGQWRSILGYDKEDMPQMDLFSFRKLVHPDDQKVFDNISVVREDNATALSESEFRMRHRDGHWIWGLSRSQITRFDSTGAPEIVGGVHLNISDRKRLEQDLASGKNFLERVMDASIAAIVVMNGDGDIIYANSEAERILNLGRSETADRKYDAPGWRATALDGAPLRKDDLPFARAIREGKPVRDARFAIEWPDGKRRCLSVNALAFAGEGEELRVVSSFNDITEELAATTRLEQARAQAEEASRSKSMFLANMSHEIRTPLNGVLGMAEVLESTLTEDRQKRMIGTIRTSGETLLSILNDILDMSKIEAGKMEIEKVPFIVNDLVQPVQALNAIRAEEKGLEFRVYTNSGCAAPLLGDPHRISQILNNLLHNAIKFTETGSVLLRLSYEPEKPLDIVVEDTGMGMSEAQVARILDSFEQADGSITRRFGGTGLGMSIVRQLVTLMRGEIRVQSEPGRGTSIRVSLPLPCVDPEALRTIESASPAGRTARLDNLTALVADDSATNRMVIDEMLRETGITIVMVENGREAVEAWADHHAQGRPFDIVLLDISMPVMDGLSALSEIRAREEKAGHAPVPVIAVTANAMPHQVADYLIAGFDTHLAKPFKRAELIHSIVTLSQS